MSKVEFGVDEGKRCPMHAISITAAEETMLERRTPVIFEQDGHSIFDLVDQKGNHKGKAVYVMFLTQDEIKEYLEKRR